MQEEVENRTVNLAISTTKLTGRTIIAGIRKYLQHREKVKMKKARDPAVHGKQSVKQLLGQNQGATNVEIDKESIQNYFQLATCISIDCRKIHRQVMTVLTNRLNTETGCKLVREGGAMTESEKERFGKSAMVRYVSGIDQPIYPIAYIKNKIPMAKKTAVCSYTADGRTLIHTNLSLNSFVLAGLRNQPSMGRSTELTDSRISLFSAQRGKCALSGELFENAADIVCWLKTPAEFGGRERYQNMILFHRRFLPLLQRRPMNELKAIADALKTTKELMLKVNSLRERAGLSAIE